MTLALVAAAALASALPAAHAACPAIAAGGSSHTLALKSDGTVWAWGYNGDGQLGDGTTTTSPLPVQVRDAAGTGFLSGVVAIAAAPQNSLALKGDGTVWAWGGNGFGQLGDGTTTPSSLPVRVKDAAGTSFLSGVTAIAAGGTHALALSGDGTVWAWGGDAYGQLGDGAACAPWPCGRGLPGQVKDPAGTGLLAGVAAIAAGYTNSLARKGDGTAWTWGGNLDGELGNGTTMDSSLPVQVVDAAGTGWLAGLAALAADSSVNRGTHSLGLASDGSVWAWGYDGRGQLGRGTICTPLPCGSSLPVQVVAPAGTGWLAGVTGVAAGDEHSLALRGDTSVWAWGDNCCGQLGNGSPTPGPSPTPSPSPTPTPAPTPSGAPRPVPVRDTGGSGFLAGVIAIAAGRAHSLALSADGSVWAWGVNPDGQLGNGTFLASSLPVRASIGVGPGVPPDQGNVLRAVRTGTSVSLSWTGTAASSWAVCRDPAADRLGFTLLLPALGASSFVDLDRVRVPASDYYRIKGLSACGAGP